VSSSTSERASTVSVSGPAQSARAFPGGGDGDVAGGKGRSTEKGKEVLLNIGKKFKEVLKLPAAELSSSLVTRTVHTVVAHARRPSIQSKFLAAGGSGGACFYRLFMRHCDMTLRTWFLLRCIWQPLALHALISFALLLGGHFMAFIRAMWLVPSLACMYKTIVGIWQSLKAVI
jgi:hypothetical protein